MAKALKTLRELPAEVAPVVAESKREESVQLSSQHDQVAMLAYARIMAPVMNEKTGRLVSTFRASAFKAALTEAGLSKDRAQLVCDAFIARHKLIVKRSYHCDTQGREHEITDRLTGNVSEEIRAFHEERKAKLAALQMSAVKTLSGGRTLVWNPERIAK